MPPSPGRTGSSAGVYSISKYLHHIYTTSTPYLRLHIYLDCPPGSGFTAGCSSLSGSRAAAWPPCRWPHIYNIYAYIYTHIYTRRSWTSSTRAWRSRATSCRTRPTSPWQQDTSLADDTWLLSHYFCVVSLNIYFYRDVWIFIQRFRTVINLEAESERVFTL